MVPRAQPADKGSVSIEDIKPGDRVLSRSEDGSVDYKPVLQVFMTHSTELMHLSYRRESSGSRRTNSNGDGDAEDGESDDQHKIIGTKVHRFWSVTRFEWIEMVDLEVGERLLLADGTANSTVNLQVGVRVPVIRLASRARGNTVRGWSQQRLRCVSLTRAREHMCG
jgi:hypothetical protein